MDRRPMTVMQSPRSRAVKKAVEATRSASSFFSCPSRREMLLPEPMPRVKPTAWMIAIRENTTPTAPVALVPSWLTKKVSAML